MIEQTRGDADLVNRLATRAQNDAAFRQQLLADPKATVEQELDPTRAPEGKVLVHERGAQNVYLVLPLAAGAAAQRKAAGQSLTDEELQGPDDPYPPPCFDCIGQGCFD